MQKFIVSLAVLIASLATASVASAACPPGQTQQGAYCEANPPGQPADRPPADPGPGNPPGPPADRPPDRPGKAGTPNGASLTTIRTLSQLGLDYLFTGRGYTRTFVAPSPGVYHERIYGRVPAQSGSGARAAASRSRYVLMAKGQRNFKRPGAGAVKIRLTKAGGVLLDKHATLRLMVKTQFVRTRNGRVAKRTTSTRTRTVKKTGTAAAS